MNMSLLYIICLLALFQGGNGRLAALVYALIFAIQVTLFNGLEGYQFFISAAIADLSILAVLCFLVNISRLSDILISVSMISGAVNAAGAIMWCYELDLTAYYHACTTLYIIVALSMLREDAKHEFSDNLLNSFFRLLGRPGYALRRVLHQETQ